MNSTPAKGTIPRGEFTETCLVLPKVRKKAFAALFIDTIFALPLLVCKTALSPYNRPAKNAPTTLPKKKTKDPGNGIVPYKKAPVFRGRQRSLFGGEP